MNTSVLGITCKVNVFQAGTEPTATGSIIAIDTETLLIDFDRPWIYPDVVVLTAYSGGDTVDFVYWYDIPEYLDKLFKLTPKSIYVFHNAPFDIGVLGFNNWVKVVDEKRVWDTGLQFLLRDISEEGFRDDKEYPSLALLVSTLFNTVLEKDSDIRCTFNRKEVPTDEHIAYACKDAIATWKCAIVLGDMPTINTQVKGFIVLDRISRNGLLVNTRQLHELRTKYMKLMGEEKVKLLTWGIKIDKDLDSGEILDWLKEFGINIPYESSQKVPITFLKYLLILLTHTTDLTEINTNINDVLTRGIGKEDITNEKIAEAEKVFAIDFARNKAGNPSPNKLQLFNVLFYFLDSLSKGKEAAIAIVHEQWERHAGWPPGYKEVGINTVLQGLLKEAEENIGVTLPKTETGAYSLNDEALSTIPDETIKKIPFLESFKAYKHYEKLCSTYLTNKYIKADGRVHSRLNPLVSTGRTSSTQPNVF